MTEQSLENKLIASARKALDIPASEKVSISKVNRGFGVESYNLHIEGDEPENYTLTLHGAPSETPRMEPLYHYQVLKFLTRMMDTNPTLVPPVQIEGTGLYMLAEPAIDVSQYVKFADDFSDNGIETTIAQSKAAVRELARLHSRISVKRADVSKDTVELQTLKNMKSKLEAAKKKFSEITESKSTDAEKITAIENAVMANHGEEFFAGTDIAGIREKGQPEGANKTEVVRANAKKLANSIVKDKSLDGLSAALDNMIGVVEKNAPNAPKTLVHGDANPSNFLHMKSGQIMMTGFDNANVGCSVYDLAVFLKTHLLRNEQKNSAGETTGIFDRKIAKSIIANYEWERKKALTSEERAMLPALIFSRTMQSSIDTVFAFAELTEANAKAPKKLLDATNRIDKVLAFNLEVNAPDFMEAITPTHNLVPAHLVGQANALKPQLAANAP